MYRSLLDLDGSPALYIPPDHPDFDVTLEGLRDLQQLGFIFEQLASNQPADFRSRLRKVAADVALPQDDLTDSRGRDAQCELYVGAICVKAGFHPTFQEPDLVCSCDGVTYGLAVKRIKSYSSFQNRIREGARQIRGAGVPGMIVCDVSVLLNRSNARIPQLMSDEEFGAVANLVLTEFINDHYRRLQDWVKGKGVQGIFFVDHHVRQHPDTGWSLDTLTIGVPISTAPEAQAEFKKFSGGFYAGMATESMRMLRLK